MKTTETGDPYLRARRISLSSVWYRYRTLYSLVRSSALFVSAAAMSISELPSLTAASASVIDWSTSVVAGVPAAA